MLIAGIIIVLGIMLIRSCNGGQRLTGDAVKWVGSTEEVPVDEILESSALIHHLSSTEPPISLHNVFELDCAQIIDSDIQHRIFAKSPDCMSFVLPHALGFDLLIYYTDAACKYPATFELKRTQGLLHIRVDKGKNRGTCELVSAPNAMGITLIRQLSDSS